jgi:Lrp/AsnC family transcriptional regulator, leucine-responsive regulatory protein
MRIMPLEALEKSALFVEKTDKYAYILRGIAFYCRLGMYMTIDALDKAILAALVQDGRQSQVQLAERVPLSPTAVARRIKALEEAGVIEGYHARLSRQALGLNMTIFIEIALKTQNEQLLADFEKAVAAAPSVVSCHLMSGENDYLITVMARDLPDFERIHKEQLSRLPGVLRLKSSFSLREVTNRQLPATALAF